MARAARPRENGIQSWRTWQGLACGASLDPGQVIDCHVTCPRSPCCDDQGRYVLGYEVRPGEIDRVTRRGGGEVVSAW